MKKIKVSFNNKNLELESEKPSLKALLLQKELLEKTGIAVAVNESVVHKKDWNNYELNNGDKILVITATQGG